MLWPMPRNRQLTLGILLGILAAYMPGGIPAASAESRTVVVLPFKGPKASSARLGVIRALKKKSQFVPADEFLGTAAEYGVDPLQPEGLVTICAKLEVDAVVTGKVVKVRRGRYRVTVTVIDGGTGMPAGGKAATVRGKRKIRRAGKAIGHRLAKLVAQTSRPIAEPTVSSEQEPKPRPRAKKKARKGKGLGGMGGLFDLSVGIGMSRRNYEMEGDDPSKNRRYDGGIYPEFNFRLDLYPAAPFMDHLVARSLGLGIALAAPMSISTTLKDKKGQAQEVDTSSLEFLLDLLFRWPILGEAPTSPVLKAAFGFGMRDFKLGENHVLPSFKYRFLRIGVDAHIPLMTPLIAIQAGIDLRPILAVGQEALDALGEKSGVFALAARGGIGGETAFGLFYGVTFEYQHFMADYAGRVEYQSKAIPAGAPSSLRTVPSSTTESYIRVWAQLGFSI